MTLGGGQSMWLKFEKALHDQKEQNKQKWNFTGGASLLPALILVCFYSFCTDFLFISFFGGGVKNCKHSL